MTTTTDITVYDRVTDPAALIESLGKSMYEARMFGCSNEAQGRVLALACIAERKNPIELARTYHIIDGKLSMRADAMLAEFRKLGGKCRWVDTGDDGKQAQAMFTFEDVETTVAYSIEDAKRAGLVRDKSNWTKDPGAMLRARVTSKAIRMLAPEIVAGYYTPEEIDDATGSREPKPATVVDAETIAKAAAAKANANGSAAAKADDAVDAEFKDKSDAAKPEEKAVEKPSAKAAEKEKKPKSGELDRPCSALERENIQKLFAAAELTPDQQTQVLAKRGAKVIRNLTSGQARELIAKLEAQIAAAATTATEATTTTVDDTSHDGPCTENQAAAIKALLKEINDDQLMRKIAAKLAEAGLKKIAELSWRDAVALHTALDCKSIEQFFERSLEAKSFLAGSDDIHF